MEEMRLSKKRLGLPASAAVMSGYEAGCDGFWFHRYLIAQGVLNRVVDSAWIYVMAFCAWRNFRNRRERGALAGLAPTPYQSGAGGREQGISKAGNRPIRAMAIEIAWSWVRHQPDRALSIWYQKRIRHGNSRIRRIGIVALARKLLIARWRYLELGVIPEGAQFKQA